jgi:hypothetical protein
VSNAPWMLDPADSISNEGLPKLVGSRAAAASSAGDLVLGIVKPGHLPVMWHARGDTLQHLFTDLLEGPLASAASGAPASRHGQDAGPIAVARRRRHRSPLPSSLRSITVAASCRGFRKARG